MSTEFLSGCARCQLASSTRLCRSPDGKSPGFCPTREKKALTAEAAKEYQKTEIREFARQASIQEAECYADREKGYDKVSPSKPRIVEIMEFARKMKYKRLGLAFCAGLQKEALVIEKLFSDHGFEVVSVICKAGCQEKGTIGITASQKVALGKPETMCNPILQAMILNDAGTELNVLLGLCVGHDSLFFKYAEAMTTVLAAKDRVLGHNPLAAVYNIDSYYRALK